MAAPAAMPNSQKATAESQPGKITPELVEEIAAKVYALMLLELSLERERRRLFTGKRSHRP